MRQFLESCPWYNESLKDGADPQKVAGASNSEAILPSDAQKDSNSLPVLCSERIPKIDHRRLEERSRDFEGYERHQLGTFG